MDNKAVGGHLPLSKRNSTPVNVNISPTATVSLHAQTHCNLTQNTSTIATPIQQALGIDITNQHRRLDRSLSEPVRPQTALQQQQQQQQPSQANSSRYKTELCRPYEENGFCKYGDKCQFAHGQQELRTMSRHPKYKTELCRTFHTSGFCPYGPRCHFIHNSEERRLAAHAPLSATSSLTLGNAGINLTQLSNYLNSAGESPSPPLSLHGSPTSPNTFFDELFPQANAKTLIESLARISNGPLSPNRGALTPPETRLDAVTLNHLAELEMLRENSQFINFTGMETPPISPVESLAGDVDSLSLSSVPSDSPVPCISQTSTLLDINRAIRLPIFEKISEDQ